MAFAGLPLWLLLRRNNTTLIEPGFHSRIVAFFFLKWPNMTILELELPSVID